MDLDSWDFVTGYDFNTIKKLYENTFLAILDTGAVNQKFYSYMFYLVNPNGEIVKKYDSMSLDQVDVLVDNLKSILSHT